MYFTLMVMFDYGPGFVFGDLCLAFGLMCSLGLSLGLAKRSWLHQWLQLK